MRVALIYLGRRGAGNWISLELALQFQTIFSTLVITSQYRDNQPGWMALESEQLILPTFHNAIGALTSLIVPTRINTLIDKLHEFQPDALLFPMFHPWNAIIQHRMSGVPAVVFVHDPRPHPDLTSWFYGKLEQSSIKQAERCIVMSGQLTDELIKRGIQPAKIDVIPLGPYRVSPSRTLAPQKRNIPTLLFFGRIMPYKGLDLLLHAYANIRQTNQARLIIAGEGDLKPFKNILNNLPDIEILNRWIPEDEIEKLFSKSDILILPYTSASQSGVIPIAASVGLPVIATHTGGIPEQIEAGISGWLVQPGSVDELTEAMRTALDHPELAHQRGEALRARYENQFPWKNIAHQVADSLEKVFQAEGQK